MACPGCARQLRGKIGLTPVSLRCPSCGLCFQARRSGLTADGWIQIRQQRQREGDYYQLLGLDADADTAAIKAAYRREAKRWHPDRHGNSEVTVRHFQAIVQAYAVLSDRQQRAVYDAEQVATDWRQWAAVAQVLTPPSSARPVGQQPWRRRMAYCLMIGLLLGIGAGLMLPRGSRLLRPFLAGVAVAGLVRMALLWRRPDEP